MRITLSEGVKTAPQGQRLTQGSEDTGSPTPPACLLKELDKGVQVTLQGPEGGPEGRPTEATSLPPSPSPPPH